MKHTNTYTQALETQTYSKLQDYTMLIKFKLTMVVVITSLLAYGVVAGMDFSSYQFLALFVGGFLVTSGANALNQVLEKDFDKLMVRTADRPVTAGRMKASEAVMFAGICCLIGITTLAMFNPTTALLGMVSFLMYAFVYTPLKRYSTLSVAVGAIPGALPVLIGCTAYQGEITLLAIGLFLIQFLWQFPHFWSIGFLSFDDYNNAGYKLLPTKNNEIERGLGKSSLFYTIAIVPFVLGLYILGEVSLIPTIIVGISTLGYAYYAYQFHTNFDRKSARSLMFSSFAYMPIVLLTYLIF